MGEYTVSVNDVNGCGGSSTASIVISAAASDIMFIYPSPNTGQFQVRYQSLEGNLFPRTLTIFDAKGSRVYVKTYSIGAPYGRMDVDLKNHAKGTVLKISIYVLIEDCDFIHFLRKRRVMTEV